MPTNAEVCAFHITWLNIFFNFFASIFVVPLFVSFSFWMYCYDEFCTSISFLNTNKKLNFFSLPHSRFECVTKCQYESSLYWKCPNNLQHKYNRPKPKKGIQTVSKKGNHTVRENMFQRYRFNWIMNCCSTLLAFGYVFDWSNYLLCIGEHDLLSIGMVLSHW